MKEKNKWEQTHGNIGYEAKVFALLDSRIVLCKFEEELSKLNDKEEQIRVLIPGCGSNVNLQVCCRNVFGDKAILYALDWSQEAIAISKRKTDELGISVNYINQSYYEMTLEPCFFDVIVMSNAIVSESFENNVAAISNFVNLLKPNGVLMGLLPSPFNMFDYALMNKDANHWLVDGTVNVMERRIFEQQFGSQRFFTPLELYVELKKNSCQIDNFELFFYDADEFAGQISKLYNISFNREFCFWGYFIKSRKKEIC